MQACNYKLSHHRCEGYVQQSIWLAATYEALLQAQSRASEHDNKPICLDTLLQKAAELH